MLINHKYKADCKYKYKDKDKHTHGQVGRSLGCCGLGLGNDGGAGLQSRADIPIELDCQVHIIISDVMSPSFYHWSD